MRLKEKVILIIIITLFLLSLSMFYYQNVYKVNKLELSKKEVLIATKDIEKNTKITEENTNWINVSPDLISDYNVLKDDEIIGKKTSEKILEGEYVNKRKIQVENEKTYDFNTYIIEIYPDYVTDLENGDLVKVYVQVKEKIDRETEKISNLLIFDKKEIVEIQRDEEGVPSKIRIRVTDKEALSYYNGKATGTIIALKYEANVDNSDYEIPVIDISQ